MIIYLIAGLTWKILHKNESLFSSAVFECSWGNEKIELDLSNNAKKVDLIKTIGSDISTLALKADLFSLKTKVDNLSEYKSHDATGFFTTPEFNRLIKILIFQLLFRTFKIPIGGAKTVFAGILQGLLDGRIKPPITTPGNCLASKLNWIHNS